MKSIGDLQGPRRLVDRSGALPELVRSFVQQTETDCEAFAPSAYAVWRARHDRRRGRWGAPIVSAIVGSLAALALVVGGLHIFGRWQGHPMASLAPPAAPHLQPSGPPLVPWPAATGTQGVSARAEDDAPAAALPVSSQRERLVAGVTPIGDEASVTLSEGGRAYVVRHADGEVRIELRRGTVTLRVAHRGPTAAPCRVMAGTYTFTVVGTEFQVRRSGSDVALDVRRGAVAVSRGSRWLATVAGPGAWRSLRRGAGPGFEETVPGPAPAAAPPEPIQEAALYRLGLTRMRSSGDLEGAAAAFRRCLTEFPHGTLRIEATLSLVEILPRLGRHQDALDLSSALLAEQPTLERAAELHLLRGNIYREAMKDEEAAAREYAAAASAPRRLGTEARRRREALRP